MRTILKTLLLGALLTSGACRNKNEDARKAQETANKKAVEADEAQREANEKKLAADREANDRLLKDRGEARDKLQKDVDAADRKLADLRHKLLDAKGDKRLNADAAANEVQQRKAKVDADMHRLSSVTGNAWDNAKLEAESDLAALNQAIDNFEKTLK
jgi:colicin import membrane protein